ncbi:flagellar filament capping protein FliD [Sulfurimonas sp. MAG313]|nr:flagellar filament capping protein FliD [Sulfurimonas sp. MAG313]MDF1881315.1 flagellar filament capping protein FliD [Sulfurimonas sp. MAG313]
MGGTINSLGIGSGVLTSDLIDKLKENERSSTVTPLDRKIEVAKQKQEAVDLLSSLTTTFKANVSALGSDILYQERSISGSNDDVGVTVQAGAATQSFSITDVSLAKADVQQSGSYLTKTATAASGSGTLTLAIGQKSYAIDYTAGTTLSDLKDLITNSSANDDLTASILQVGDNDYTLVLTSKITGSDQTITITDDTGNLNSNLLSTVSKSGAFVAADDTIAAAGTTGNVQIDINGISSTIVYDDTTTLTELKDLINKDSTLKGIVTASIVQEGDFDFKLVLNPTGAQSGQTVSITDSSTGLDAKLLSTGSTSITGTLTEVQSAKDSSFKYNGITLTRSSNTISDISSGVTINLKKDAGTANISISQDKQPIIDELNNFVSSYNSLQTQLSAMTRVDLDAGKVGIFIGDATVKGISREITKLVNSVNSNNQSLAQFGIELDKIGNMTLNTDAVNKEDGRLSFTVAFEKDPKAVESFFSGFTTVDSNNISTRTDGVFSQLNTLLKGYTKTDGLLALLDSGLETNFKSLDKQRTKTLDLLNARYETMTKRFVAYDLIINRLNLQTSALNQQIDMSIAAARG